MKERAEWMLYILRHECRTKTSIRMGKRRVDAIVEIMEGLLAENKKLREENERLHKENFWLTGGGRVNG